MLASSRKGQSGSGAATLVAVITLLIVLYLLFLPPDVRKDLLESEDNGNGGGGSFGRSIANLLLENPGRIEQLDKLEIEHNLPSINLFSLAGAKILTKANSVYIKNGIFDKKNERVSFQIKELKNTDNVLLSFSVRDARGRLIIRLNGDEIYNNEVRTANVAPIELPKDMLLDTNALEFSVSEVGMVFWRTNEYTLENVQVTADITDITAQESKNVFVISQTEKLNLEKARLRFFPDCSQSSGGLLEVMVNNNPVYSSVPECGALKSVEFSPSYLENGDNRLLFKAAKGRYVIDQISVTTYLKEVAAPAYFFNLDSSQYADITSNRKDVNLTMRFIDNDEYKRGKIVINGKTLSINTRDAVYSRIIDNYVEVGSNGMKIEPGDKVLDVVELRIDLVRD